MMLKTVTEIARLKKVTKIAVKFFITNNGIIASGKKGKRDLYDIEADPLAAYLKTPKRQKPIINADKKESKQTIKLSEYKKQDIKIDFVKTPKAAKKTQLSDFETETKNKINNKKIIKPLNDLLVGETPLGRTPSSMFYLKAIELAEENKDSAMLLKLGQIADKEDRDEQLQLQMIKTEQAKEQIAQERAERLKIENDVQRGLYIERDIIKIIFGKWYAVHTSQLQPVGIKLADTIDSIPAGADRKFAIQKVIDNEIYGVLASLQRIMTDFINSEE